MKKPISKDIPNYERMRKRMKKLMALLTVLALLLSCAALADSAEPGLLRTAILYEITTMDVAQTSDDYMIPINVFDRLFETRSVNGNTEVVKSLVTDYTLSDDGLTYEFTLLEGVKFSNGNPLTASDVKFTFERLLKKADMNTDIPEEVAGGPEMLEGKADSLEGFTVKDDTHFSITLRAPNAGFLAELSSPGMSIVDEESVTAAGSFGTGPADTIGSGPYKVTEWETNDHFTLEYLGHDPIVDNISNPNSQVTNLKSPIYDLLGRRSTRLTRGLNIVGGKKIVKK